MRDLQDNKLSIIFMPALLSSCPTRKELGLLNNDNNTHQTYNEISNSSIIIINNH